MANRMEVLQNSLKKKQEAFDKALQSHMEDVASGNGQPMNDKRNGRATMNRWDAQNNRLRKLNEEIEKTKIAIENEQFKTNRINTTNNTLPQVLLDKVASSELQQWRKYPNFFFVTGIKDARMQYKDGKMWASHYNELSKEDYAVFAAKFNEVKKLIQLEQAQNKESV